MENVVIVDPDPGWPALFETERAAISSALIGIQIEHIGSTSVPGLAAKPVIDILVGVGHIPPGPTVIGELATLDFEHIGELGIPDRHFFRKGKPRTHNLHMVAAGSAFWNDHVLFRNFLRAHPKVAARYGDLKRELAVKFREDRDAYTDAKTPFITEVMVRARCWKTESRML